NTWDFDTDMVTSDVTLYAKWTTNTYTVTFNKNGGDTEANPRTKTAIHGDNVGTLPTAPTRTGYIFVSWNTKTNGSGTEFKTTTAVIADITVYAQWTINTYSVTFDSQGGSTVSSQTVNHGVKVTEPTDPVWAGHTFTGWYKESVCTNTWDFDTDTVISDVTLYAKWIGSVHNTTQDICYTAIQPALDAAVTGDTIEVNDGTYAESITFPNGILITLKSLNDASSTFITGVDGFATVTCSSSLGGTTLEGFTINHESGYTGRGITVTAGYLTIKNCTVSNNSVTDDSGGGIYNGSGTLTITDSEISNNFADSNGYHGGGIYNENGTAIITSSTISNNSADDYGGGIYNEYGDFTITSSTISTNTADDSGGGIYHENGTAIITSSTISINSATDFGGGGIYSSDTLTITDSEISGNFTPDGGGIYHWSGTLTITSSTISGNTATNGNGGGIYNGIGDLIITGGTISGNTAEFDGGGIYIESSSPTIKNNTISGNTASTGNGGGIYIESGSPTIGGANESDFNIICGNTPLPQINPDSYPNNFIFTNCDVIGETGPAGGLIFYDKGEVSNGWRYLEAAPSDQHYIGDYTVEWGCYGVSISGADGIVVGTGDQNTIDIEAGCATLGTAADICANLSLGVYNDWFLPSQDELSWMYTNLKVAGVGGFADYYYWSSSEYNALSVWSQHFNSGLQNGRLKNDFYRVRAVRAF
ncbi:MAG: InlB B-repeat-containing protein, partial [Candidatus Atribacteria bacterium]|nr:InlB B-repeat-containing protein [Candidatus Atribacteria bacterium]